jgi:hypothetical protein
MATLVQSTVGGSASGSIASSANITSSAAGFSGSTTTGNLILLVVWVTNIGGGGISLPTPPAISGGYSGSFSSNQAAFWKNGFNQQDCLLYWIANAPSMSPSNTVTVTASNVGIHTGTVSVEFDLYEFGNIVNPVVIETNLNVSHSNVLSNSTPATTFTATANTNLIVSVLCAGDPGANISAGSGYTLGFNAAVALTGQMQYQLSAPPGQTSSSFTGTEPYWGCLTVAFKTPASGSQPILQVSPLALLFSAVQSGSNPASQNISISNLDGGTLNWVMTSDSPWLSGSPTSGTGNGTVAASVNIAGLAAGTYTGHLTVTAAGTTGSPQTVVVTLNILASTGGGGGSCIPNYTSGLFVSDLSLYIGPATSLYASPVPTVSIAVNESVTQGRNAIILDFNNSEGLYARDLGVVFSWPVGSGVILDLWQPTIIPEQDDLYNRLSYHFLLNALGLTGWGHIRELNIAHNATAPINLLLQFDQWPNINLTIPSAGGATTKVKVVLPANKFKMVEGFLSSSQPFMLWGESCELKLGQWGRSDGYRVLKPFSG